MGVGGSSPLLNYDFILNNVNNKIRIVGTRPLSASTIVRPKMIMPYLDKKETKLVKTERACPYWKENGWKRYLLLMTVK